MLVKGELGRWALCHFVDKQDACILLDRLNADPEIAFVVPDGPRMAAAGVAVHRRGFFRLCVNFGFTAY